MTLQNYFEQVSKPTDCLNWVNDQWVKPRGQSHLVHSPYTGQALTQVFQSTAQDVGEIAEKAQAAALAWGRTPIKERSAVLYRYREILKRDLESISFGIAAESGKTPLEAQAGLLKGIEVLEYALSLQNLDLGGRLEVSRGVYCEVRREPLGVVAGITPFNFPAMVPMWMIPIALATGNAFVWKPSDKTPLTSIRLAHALKEAGLPSGVFSVVQGGKVAVESILDHPLIKAVGFVGSTPIARAVYTRGTSNGKRVLALGGAKNHIILMPDADTDMAARGITDSYTGCAGQRCMAASVLLAVEDGTAATQKIIDSILEKSSKIRLGQDMGAIISRESQERIIKTVKQAPSLGAKIVLDGTTATPPSDFSRFGSTGNWMGPTLLDQVRPGTETACTEIFGPVLSIIRVRSLSEALEIQKRAPFGNACSVFTSNGAVADRVALEAHAGMIGINIGVPVPREPFSFGGVDDSRFGSGDITGAQAVDFWTSLKKVTTKWMPATDRNWMN